MQLSDGTSIPVDACPHQRAGVQTRGCTTGKGWGGLLGGGCSQGAARYGMGGYPQGFVGVMLSHPVVSCCSAARASSLPGLAASAAGWREAPGTRPSRPRHGVPGQQ